MNTASLPVDVGHFGFAFPESCRPTSTGNDVPKPLLPPGFILLLIGCGSLFLLYAAAYH
jgi:hypothetical protein